MNTTRYKIIIEEGMLDKSYYIPASSNTPCFIITNSKS